MEAYFEWTFGNTNHKICGTLESHGEVADSAGTLHTSPCMDSATKNCSFREGELARSTGHRHHCWSRTGFEHSGSQPTKALTVTERERAHVQFLLIPDWAQLRNIKVYKDHATISTRSIPIASTFCRSCWLRTSIPSHLRIPTARPRMARWRCSKGWGNERWMNERGKSNHYNKSYYCSINRQLAICKRKRTTRNHWNFKSWWWIMMNLWWIGKRMRWEYLCLYL